MPEVILYDPFAGQPVSGLVPGMIRRCWRNVGTAYSSSQCQNSVPDDAEHVGLCERHIRELREDR